jgi:hypothetical protein
VLWIAGFLIFWDSLEAFRVIPGFWMSCGYSVTDDFLYSETQIYPTAYLLMSLLCKTLSVILVSYHFF